MSEWIDINQQKPDCNRCLVAWSNGKDRRISLQGYSQGVGFVPGVYLDYQVTHWMPLPELPKEGESCTT